MNSQTKLVSAALVFLTQLAVFSPLHAADASSLKMLHISFHAGCIRDIDIPMLIDGDMFLIK